MNTATGPAGHAPRRTHTLDRVATVLAILLHAGVGVFPVSATGLLAPLWFVVAAWLGWVVGAITIWRRRHHPRTLWVIPVATAALWWIAVAAGGALLLWTA